MFLMMQTVISWRRPIEGAAMYPRTSNACSYLLGTTLCYVIAGMMLLVVGVIITSMSFQNLEDYKNEKRERYAGPVMIAVGILVLARGAFSRLRPPRSELSRRRSFIRRYIREIYSRPIIALRSSTSLSLCDFQTSELDDCSRTMLYNDEPPSYDLATSDEYSTNLLQGETNLANDVERQSVSEAPPSYEEFMNSEDFHVNIQTTQL